MQLIAFGKRLPVPGRLLIKTLQIMKLTAIFLLIAWSQLNAKGYSQKISLSEKNAPLEHVFADIEKQTGYSFFFNYAWLDKAHRVTLEMRGATLEQALDSCFKDQPFTYTIVNMTIVIKQKLDTKETNSLAEFALDIRGKVTNEKGEPVVGATVSVKGSKTGVATNDNGEFFLDKVNGNGILLISSVGF